MKLIIVRHGETFENAKGIAQGQYNSQLNDNGIEQAKKIALRLKEIHIDVAYASDLDRAARTCEEILRFHPHTPYIKTPALREQAKGILEGKTREERALMPKDRSIPDHLWRPEGGERIVDVWDKVIGLIEDIAKQYPDKTILIVSHGGPIACILTYLHKDPIEVFGKHTPHKNTATTIVQLHGEDIIFETLNCADHIA